MNLKTESSDALPRSDECRAALPSQRLRGSTADSFLVETASASRESAGVRGFRRGTTRAAELSAADQGRLAL